MNLFENLQLMKEVDDKYIQDDNIWVHTFKDGENHNPSITTTYNNLLGPGFYLFNTKHISSQFNTGDIDKNEYYKIKNDTNILTLNSTIDKINVTSMFGFKKCDNVDDLFDEIKTHIGKRINGSGLLKISNSNISWIDFITACRWLSVPYENFIKYMITHNIDAIIVNNTDVWYKNYKTEKIVKEMCVFNFDILDHVDKSNIN